MNRRVVFDTSTLVSAALRPGSIPHQALIAAFAIYDLCGSAETLTELERVLLNEKFDRYLNRKLRKQFIDLMHRHIHLFAVRNEDVLSVRPPCRDPKDKQFLALTVVAEAGILVSSDEDLLVLHPRNNVVILNPALFLAQSQT